MTGANLVGVVQTANQHKLSTVKFLNTVLQVFGFIPIGIKTRLLV